MLNRIRQLLQSTSAITAQSDILPKLSQDDLRLINGGKGSGGPQSSFMGGADYLN